MNTHLKLIDGNVVASRNGHYPSPHQNRTQIAVATAQERETIYRFRHQVYARELAQHPENKEGCLRDPLDDFNTYLVARDADGVVGFISITPPGKAGYSIDKYLSRDQLPFLFDSGLYEVRLLTVVESHRGRAVATLLMYAALRWVEAQGGTRIMAIGRREILDLYLKSGLRAAGFSIQAGAVTYEVLQAPTDDLRARVNELAGLFDKLERKTEWQLGVPFQRPAPCFHGGAFFAAIGDEFDHLERSKDVVNADVLDAWFPPSPTVTAALREHLSWLVRTSPPTGCEGLVRAIARARGVPTSSILAGAGSSALIFLAFRHWLKRASRVLLLDPTYGEYAHVLEKVVRCRVDRLPLWRDENYQLDTRRLESTASAGYDLVVLVNPNSPTGQHVSRAALEDVLSRLPDSTRVWIDETYIDYVSGGESIEPFAAQTENVVVCKSMSKGYALSGARVAYLCAASPQLEELRSITPPWAVSLPGQVAAVMALQDPNYYAQRYRETRELRGQLMSSLRALNVETIPSVANFVLAHLSPDGPDAACVVRRCRESGVFLRDASVTSPRLGAHALRVAVKDEKANRRIVDVLTSVLRNDGGETRKGCRRMARPCDLSLVED